MKNAAYLSRRNALVSVFILFVLLSLLTCIAPKAAEDTNTAPNGYVSQMSLTTFTTKTDNIPGFEFTPSQTTYELQISAANNMSNLLIDFNSVPSENPYCKVEYLNSGTKKTLNEKQISVGTQYKQLMSTPLGIVKLGQAPIDVIITIGDKDNGYADADIYTLRLSRKPGLNSLAVQDPDGNSLELSPIFPKNSTSVAYVDTYSLTVLEGTEKVTLITDPSTKYGGGNNVEYSFYLNQTECTENPKDGIEINLGEYTADENGIKEIPFSFHCKSETYPSESSYKLRISEKSLTPVIINQPQNISCNQDDDVSLSVAANPPEGYEDAQLTYQWLRVRSLSLGLYDEIAGENSSTFSPHTSTPGYEQYACRITHEVNGERYYIISDPADVRVALTHIVPPELTILAGGNVTTLMGSSPGMIRFQHSTLQHSFNADVSLRNLKVYITDSPNEDGRLIEGIHSFAGAEREHMFDVGTQYATGTYYYYFTIEFYAEDKQGNAIDTIDPVTVKSDIITHTYTGYEGIVNGLEGSGTSDDPFLIQSYDDLVYIRDELIHKGHNMWGISFKLTTDIALPVNWVPIGTFKDPSIIRPEGEIDGKMGANIYAFMGKIDGGNHTVTVAEGGLPLFRFVADAVVENLNIKGENIASAGLVTDCLINYGPDGDYKTGCPDMITLNHVTLKSGSRTKGSGLLKGSGSGENTIRIQNCTVEEDVIIGDGTEPCVGSFVGELNGSVTNCVSYATVKGSSKVGGIAGKKGQSMGGCIIRNCAFYGTVEASGKSAGGILGAGYEADSAPNTPVITVQNCLVSGKVAGTSWVGGIVGSEGGVVQAWNDGAVTDNVFIGSVTATDAGGLAGGIMGYCNSLNKHQLVANNYYLDTCGAAKGIGGIQYVWTNCATHETASGATYRNGDHDRSDDPLGADAEKLSMPKSAEAMKDGSVVKLLNDSETSLHNWAQGENSPVLSDGPIVTRLDITGSLTTQHYIGDPLNLSGLTLTAAWSDGKTENVPLDDPSLEVSGYDSNTRGVQTVTLSYHGAKAEVKVTVLKNETGTITVQFKLLGDYVHEVSTSNTHTLASGNLSRWIPSSGPEEYVSYTVDTNATVKDVVEEAVGAENISNPTGNYIDAITWNNVTLGEFTNGSLSGWMYTINGVHSNLGVSEQFLNDGDKIIFHYTDDHTKESAIGPGGADLNSLIAAINNAMALKREEYTPESWAVLQTALENANRVAQNSNATAQQIADAQTALTAAVDALQRVQLADFRQALRDTLDYIDQTVPAPAFGTTSGEWSVLALARGGYDPGAGYFDEYYDRIVETVRAAGSSKLHAQKSTDNSRLILALSAIGRDPRNVGGVNLLAPLSDFDWVEYQGVNGTIFALLALDARNYPEPGENTRAQLVDRIVSSQLSGGGFPINRGGEVDVDITAMALQALAPYKAQANVSNAIDKALNYLASVQNANGGFGNNSEVNVQAIVALSALGIDARTDPRFVKPGGDPVTALLNYGVDGGGFKHLMSQSSPNAMATDQGAYALVAYTRFLDGENRLYDMTDVELAASGTVEVPVEPEVTDTTATAKPSLDAALETAKNEEKGIIHVTVAEKQKDKVAVILNSITANAIADANKTLNVTTENGGLSIAHNALKSIAEKASEIASTEEIILNVERKRNEDEAVKQTVTAALDKLTGSLSETKDQIAEKASIIEVTIKVNDQPITTFGGHSLSVDLPVSRDLYTAGKRYKTLVISAGGGTEEITGRCRDVNGKRVVTVQTTHLSTFVVVPVLAAAEPEKPDQPNRPVGNGEIEVRFTLLGDSIHGESSTPHTLRGGNLDTWVSQTTYTLKEGSTVWDLLRKVFSDNGMTCSNPSGNYVESITWKGKTLGEFTNGKNSGWMYTLNGTHPSLGVSEQVLEDGDRIVWHYTDDYTKEEGSEKWGGGAAKPELEAGIMQPKVTADKNGAALAELDAESVKSIIAAAKENNWTELIIQPQVEGTASKIGIVLTKEIADTITGKSDLSLSLRTKYGDASLTNAGLKGLSGTMKKTLTLSVEKTGSGTVKVDVSVDGKSVSAVTDGLRVALPVEGTGNVIAIIENGTEKIIRKSIVDGKKILTLTDGSCELRVIDNSKSFGDTSGHWSKDAVDFVSSHELFNGTGANTFAPDTAMSRAMLATVLFRLEDAAADGSNPFGDVAAGTWYTDAVIWASGNGIVNGTGNGFAPDRNVTRQELVAMLYRYANSVGMDTSKTDGLEKFTDRSGVADWAKDAMGWAVANGLVNGRTATTLAPEGTATRGEVAAITQRLVTWMVK